MSPARLTPEQRTANKRASGLAWYHRNKENRAAYAAQYHREHSEARSVKAKVYEERARERRRDRKRQYRLDNKERTAARYREKKATLQKQMAAYYAANADHIKARVRAWALDNREAIRVQSSTKRARKKAQGGNVSSDIVARLMVLQRRRCPVCQIDLHANYHLDHIEPLARGGKHDDKNMQLLCKPCNLSKHAKPPIEFMQSRGYLL